PSGWTPPAPRSSGTSGWPRRCAACGSPSSRSSRTPPGPSAGTSSSTTAGPASSPGRRRRPTSASPPTGPPRPGSPAAGCPPSGPSSRAGCASAATCPSCWRTSGRWPPSTTRSPRCGPPRPSTDHPEAPVPELPEIQAHAERLTDDLGGAVLDRFQPLSFTALKTATPPPEEAVGHPLAGVGRRGKHLLLRFGPVTFVVHLMQGGRLRPDAKQAARPRGGQARWRFADGRALLLTEAGTERRAGVWVVAGDPLAQP